MADEYSKRLNNRPLTIPAKYNLEALRNALPNWRYIIRYCCASWVSKKACWSKNIHVLSLKVVLLTIVLTNPPFGKKSSQTFTNEEDEQEKDDFKYNRQDFFATTGTK